MAIRVALITPPLDASGGIGRLMSYVVTAMPSEDVAITVLDPRGRSRLPLLSLFPLVRAWLTLILLGATRRVDVAHINMSSHGSSIRKPVMMWTCRLFRIPTILHLHASEYPEFYAALPSVFKSLLRITFSNADMVLVLGVSWQRYLCDELRVPEAKVKVLLNGAPGPPRLDHPRSRGTDPLKVLFLGRLCERKGVRHMLEALGDPRVRNESWIATLAGDGASAPYRRRAEELGLADRVSFSGWVDSDEARAMLADTDVLVLPSHAEGLPMSVIEAFAHGVAVVSTPVGAIPEILEDAVNGLLVSPGDSAQLAQALLTILQDEPLRRRLAESGRRTWEDRLDISSFSQQLALFWRELAEPRADSLRHI